MKRARKLTMEIVQRELTVALSLQHGSPSFPSGVGSEEAPGVPNSCRVCGASASVSLPAALAACSGDEEAFSRALAIGDIHISPSGGALCICEPSLKSFLATLPPHSKGASQ
jgi:hypothetical protein